MSFGAAENDRKMNICEFPTHARDSMRDFVPQPTYFQKLSKGSFLK